MSWRVLHLYKLVNGCAPMKYVDNRVLENPRTLKVSRPFSFWNHKAALISFRICIVSLNIVSPFLLTLLLYSFLWHVIILFLPILCFVIVSNMLFIQPVHLNFTHFFLHTVQATYWAGSKAEMLQSQMWYMRWKRTMEAEAEAPNTPATWCKELIYWKDPGKIDCRRRRGDGRGSDGWQKPLNEWTWV